MHSMWNSPVAENTSRAETVLGKILSKVLNNQAKQKHTQTDLHLCGGTRFLAIVESRFPHGQARLVRSHFCASSLCGPARLAESFSAMPSSAAPAHRLVEEAAWKKAVMFAATERRRYMTKSHQRRRTTVVPRSSLAEHFSPEDRAAGSYSQSRSGESMQRPRKRAHMPIGS